LWGGGREGGWRKTSGGSEIGEKKRPKTEGSYLDKNKLRNFQKEKKP